jgi:RHS repeat-associated protein
MKTTTLVVCLTLGCLHALAQSTNSVQETVVNVPNISSVDDANGLPIGSKNVTTSYFDGLGRPIQTVQQQASPAMNDVVVPVQYDAFGRQVKTFLPYAAGSGDGTYKTDAFTAQPGFYSNDLSDLIKSDTRPFSETVFEPSPMNRPVKVWGAGKAWYDGNRATSQRYLINQDGTGEGQEQVFCWKVNSSGDLELSTLNGGFYVSNQLMINSTIDEEGHEVREYKDKEGQIILKKVQYVPSPALNNKDHWAQTYYGYDDFGLLRFVIQPELSKVLAGTPTSDQLSQFVFQYKYDGRRRMVSKKVPGAGWVEMIYDSWDRVILTQDARQHDNHQWLYTRYDALNRPVVTGIYTHNNTSADRSDMEAAVANTARFESFNVSNAPHGYTNNMFAGLGGTFDVLTVTYYDDYTWKQLLTTPANFALSEYDYKASVADNQYVHSSGPGFFPRVKGQVTGSKVRVLGTPDYLNTVSYYDDRYRVVQGFSSNHKGGYDRTTKVYDFVGKPLVAHATHFALGTATTTRERFFYDHMGRLEQVMFKLNDESEILMMSQQYNELGQLIAKRLHATSDPAIGQQGTKYGNDIVELSQYNGEKVVVARTKVVLKPGFSLPGHSDFTARVGGDWDTDDPQLDNSRFSQVIDYRYNIRGWLSRINDGELAPDATNDPADYFGMNLYYENQNTGLGNNSLYNGNISGVKWNNFLGTAEVKEKGYKYSYDALNRIASSDFQERSSQWDVLSNNRFGETGFEYDMNGNIQKLKRNDERASSLMDDLQYTYEGNRLKKVDDNGDDLKGFVDGANADDDYQYDQNGNMTRDLNKGINSDIVYNHLNLPQSIVRSQNSIQYTYDASGTKLAQVTNFNGQSKTVDYIGRFQYENGVLQSVATDDGRVLVVGSKLLYQDAFTAVESVTPVSTSVAAYPNVTDAEYVRVTSNGGSAGVHPIGGEIAVEAGQKIKIRLKAYSTTVTSNNSQGWLRYVVNGTQQSAKALIPSGVTNEAWVEVTVAMPAGASELTIGAGWDASSAGDELFLNELEVILLEKRDPEYQYYLKDHLGNIRLTYTTRNEYDNSLATLETAEVDREQSEFLRYDMIRKIKSVLFDHTNDPNDGYALRLNGSADERQGLAKTISVMPGDEITARIYAKYIDPDNSNPGAFLTAFAAQMASPPTGMVVDGPSHVGSGNVGLGITPIDHAGETESGPLAYINYIFINKNYDLASVRSLSRKVSAAAAESGTTANGTPHEELSISDVIKEPGYVYIYLSNDNFSLAGQEVDVFFDDFEVKHSKSKVVQADDFYPFGLTFNSYRREASIENIYQYNGKEIQNELALRWNDFGARMYMSDIGRWGVVDPLAEKMRKHSPYNYAFDNPMRFIDEDGMRPSDIILKGLDNERTLSQLNSGLSGVTVSMGSDGKLIYSVTGKSEWTKADQAIANAIDDHSVDVTVNTTMMSRNSNGGVIIGGAFIGTQIGTDGRVKSTNEYDTTTGGRIDAAYNKPGGTILHEISEGHEASKMAEASGQPSGPEGTEGSVYDVAHATALKQPGKVSEKYYNNRGQEMPGVRDAQNRVSAPVTDPNFHGVVWRAKGTVIHSITSH